MTRPKFGMKHRRFYAMISDGRRKIDASTEVEAVSEAQRKWKRRLLSVVEHRVDVLWSKELPE